MKTGVVKYIKAARKYSNALIEAAVEAKIQDKVYNDLLFVSETINTNPALANALLNPVVTVSDKKEIAQKIFSVHIKKITLDFIYLLIDKNRLNIIEEIINQYSVRLNKLNNIVNPTVISAIELNERQKNKIINKLEQKLTKTVLPVYEINPDIIGGLIFEIGDKTIDFSLKAKFDNMKKYLAKGNKYGNN